jgi:hypothetical protein
MISFKRYRRGAEKWETRAARYCKGGVPVKEVAEPRYLAGGDGIWGPGWGQGLGVLAHEWRRILTPGYHAPLLVS